MVEEDWDFYQLLVDEEPASMFLNLALRPMAPIASLDWCGYLRISMLRPQPNGLSSQEEYDDLHALGEAVTSAVSAAVGGLYVGRNTCGGFRDLFFYFPKGAGFESAVEGAMLEFPRYGFEWGARPEPGWDLYLDFLYPGPNGVAQINARRTNA